MQSNNIPKLTTEQQENLKNLIIIAIYKKIYTDNIIDRFKIIELIKKHQRGDTL
ncbi:MAG: hypothetical protein ACI4WH_00080 [Oscillospiraceae bacterium]